MSDSERDSKRDPVENLLQKKEYNKFKREKLNYENLSNKLVLHEFLESQEGISKMIYKIKRKDMREERPSDTNLPTSTIQVPPSKKNFDN